MQAEHDIVGVTHRAECGRLHAMVGRQNPAMLNYLLGGFPHPFEGVKT